jgi:hypothetical protein
MNAREFFDVKPCTNPWHELVVGRMLLMWRIANDKWVHITNQDQEIVHWFRVGTVRNMDGQKLYEIVLGKLLIMWGFAS